MKFNKFNFKKFNFKMEEKLKYRLLSVVLAISLWYIVIGIENPIVEKEFTKVPIIYKNADILSSQNLTFVGQKIDSVDLKIRGKTNSFVGLKVQDIIAEVDLKDYSDENTELRVKYILPEGLTIISKSIGELQIKLEELVTKEVKIELGQVNKPSDKFTVQIQKMEPETVVIKGAKSQVESVAKVEALVDFAQINQESRNLPIYALDTNNNTIDGLEFSQSFTNVVFSITETKKLPIELVTVGELAKGTKVTKKEMSKTEVSVKGKPTILKSIDKIKTDDLDLTKIKSGESAELGLIIPEGLELIDKEKTVSVKYVFDQEIVKDFDIPKDKIEIRNKNDNIKNVVIKDSVTNIMVKVSGLKSKIDQLSQDSIKLYIDAEKIMLFEGVEIEQETKIPIEYDPIEGVKIYSIFPQNLTIEVK